MVSSISQLKSLREKDAFGRFIEESGILRMTTVMGFVVDLFVDRRSDVDWFGSGIPSTPHTNVGTVFRGTIVINLSSYNNSLSGVMANFFKTTEQAIDQKYLHSQNHSER